MKKDSFVFYTEWFQSIDELPPEVRLEVYDAIKVYVTTGEVPSELSQLAKAVFSFIRRDLERTIEKYNAKYQRNKETTQYQQFLKDGRWQRRRLEIMERDGFKCCDCGTSDDLHVHHLQYISGLYPWEYDDEDLITLCAKCHKKRHK